ncbi:bZIP transcription factor 29 [Linum perenne]
MHPTMRQSSPSLDLQETSSNKRIGLPPSHPNNQHFFASGLVSDQHHSRSLSQSSSMFSIDCLPPIGGRNMPHSMEQNAASSQGMPVPVSRVNDGVGGLPPLRAAHRRAMSDTVPLGFCDMIHSSPQLLPIRGQVGVFDRLELVKQESGWVEGMSERRPEGVEVVATDEMMSAYMHLDNVDPLNSSGTEDNKDLDSRASGTKTNGTESSDNEAESHVKGLKRSADGDIGPAGRHCRSVSMDSFMGGLRLDDESMMMKLPPIGQQHHSPGSSSMQGHLSKFNLEFGNGEFTEAELKKIMSNDKLTELAMADPKRVKRILANRLSAARSKERKMRYIAELELKVQGLQAEATTLSAQVTVLQRDSANLTSQNNELKFRLQATEQQAQLKDALGCRLNDNK